MIALKLIDSLLSDFGLNTQAKKSLIESMNNAYKIEFGYNEYNSKPFNIKFRENKQVVESVLNDTIKDKAFIGLFKFIVKRSKVLYPIVEQIKRKSQKSVDLDNLLKNYLHMMLNRLFRSKNRMHELVLYDFMRRYYTSEIAKLKYSQIL
jgi:thiopeptide-type bacteriocin biosynthesis protein